LRIEATPDDAAFRTVAFTNANGSQVATLSIPAAGVITLYAK
jgi:hypothetical protein